MKQKFITLIILFSVHFLSAQITFSGKVLDSDHQPLPEVNILIKGTNTGTISNFDGEFSITAQEDDAVLIFSMVGFVTKKVKGSQNMVVIMSQKQDVLNEIVLVGTRNPRMTKLETPVPVDIVDISEIKVDIPQTTLNDMLTYLVPSFNSNRQSASDGTEHIDPASLRGLGPDQTLVLVNGKRRHTTSLLNNQSTVGNGSVGTDLSAIPSSAIERIEVLRDGASAQYGSDAIAGVINLVLKKNTGLEASTTYGITSEGDGNTFNLNLNYGTEVGNGGFLNLTAEFNDRQSTDRSTNHDLIIYDQSDLGNYFAYPFTDDPEASRARDDELIAAAGLVRDDFNFHVGDAAIRNVQFFANFSLPVSEHGEIYASGGTNFRKGTGYGFRRLPSEGHVLEIYPNGFQPELISDITDLSMITGFKTLIGNWNFDISNTAGGNSFYYDVDNTVNDALGADSPTSFDAGGHKFFQNTVNMDVSNYKDNLLKGTNFAFGAEFRYEKYQIVAGEEASYIGSGANSFPGFSPDNEVNESRTSIGAYADIETNITESFMIGAAARYENYSDFGSTLNGKLSSRLKLGRIFALRGSVSTGFRAPSLHQQFFNNITTDIVDGVLLNNGTFRNDSEVAKQLGIPKLKEETSVNMSIGMTANVSNNFNVTVDAYKIDIDDRIIYTGSLGNDPYGNPIEELRELFEPYGVETARFFTNAVNSTTKGVDVTMNYKVAFEKSKLNFSLLYSYNETEVDDELNNVPEIFIGQEDVYFGPQERSLLETNYPKNKAIFTIDYNINKFGVMLRNTYFGEVTRNGFPFGVSQTHSGKVVTDLSASYRFTDQINFVLGASNLFNVYPDKQVYDNSYFGVFPYAPVQMGTTGSFFFGRLTYKL